MKSERIHSKKELLPCRKELRANLTPAEAFLWKQLKAKQLDGKRFVKQHSIGGYIVDFYCASEKLIVELDGEVHQNPIAKAYDQRRTSVIQSMGYKVIRFENKMVFDHLKSVLIEIKDNFKT
ncbi:MAG: endonuclease domain-containing protein [Maribacter sp.]|jgi:very-short-patch-repair endonuclease